MLLLVDLQGRVKTDISRSDSITNKDDMQKSTRSFAKVSLSVWQLEINPDGELYSGLRGVF